MLASVVGAPLPTSVKSALGCKARTTLLGRKSFLAERTGLAPLLRKGVLRAMRSLIHECSV
jgi:hypothetical protein